jgi:hypothetical protein
MSKFRNEVDGSTKRPRTPEEAAEYVKKYYDSFNKGRSSIWFDKCVFDIFIKYLNTVAPEMMIPLIYSDEMDGYRVKVSDVSYLLKLYSKIKSGDIPPNLNKSLISAVREIC